MRDGNRSNSVKTPVAIAECLALGLEEVRRIVADRKAFKALHYICNGEVVTTIPEPLLFFCRFCA